MDKEVYQLIEGGLMVLITTAIGWAAKSVSSLNTKIGVVIERLGWHQKEIEDHTKRISILEKRHK